MSFCLLAGDADAPALLVGNPLRTITYGALTAACDGFNAMLGRREHKRLGFLLCRNDVPSLTAYLASLRAGDCVALLPDTLPDAELDALIARYLPDWLLGPRARMQDRGGLDWHDKRLALLPRDERPIHPDLALLLSTSGTTGSPRMVRLSYANLAANAASIAEYLELNSSERPITTLPMHYSYGLSVINSHLHVGAAALLTDDAVTSRPFWDLFREGGATSLAGVPFTWQMLARLRIERMSLPSLRTLTQAGGRLSPELTEHFRRVSEAQGWRFFVMYGQTEATARIAYLPPDLLATKLGAIGKAIPGGALSLGDEGELVYRGPNVMLGYAESRDELAWGDTLNGVLHTGDLARQDEDGIFWLTGRIKRIAKVFGNRVNLDEVETLLGARLGSAVAALDEDDALRVVLTDSRQEAAALEVLRSTLGVHPSGLRVCSVIEFPLTSSGKLDYPALRLQLKGQTDG
ncbi:AMP-binding protein [Niveibacterium sp. 24ML]|uniref:AMP-binding protein n=1 Tax=Niveibacterium sp. 24ML TaxID=2985512 RepID=UPI00227106CD|nr:AMP-binding protein [Niveibacterium sp. 24ML]MCX9156158.1 AMP-binding protein [Niveibacterium sp. 24ML]